MLVKKEKNSNDCYNISLVSDEGKVLQMAFGGNLDLYWEVYDSKSDSILPRIDFLVTKENFYVWNLFDQLYNGVSNYWDNIRGSQLTDNHEFTECLRRGEERNPQRLFKDGVIEWHHDGHPYDEANVMRLSKDGDNYVVEMEFNNKNYVMDGNSVRFSNSGSRYQPYNNMFMAMFNELQSCPEDCHQIHMEEVFYEQDKPKGLRKTKK